MLRFRTHFIIAALLIAAVVFVWPIAADKLSPRAAVADNGAVTLALSRPAWLSVAQAQDVPNFLENEAGIAAYVNVGRQITLSTVRSIYRSIEAEDETYLIGSVPSPGYDENWDVHVYTHVDGWLVAYYPRNEPAVKMVDWASDSIDTGKMQTQLAKVLTQMMGVVGARNTDVGYYDFRYPDATGLVLMADRITADGTDQFQFEIPGELVVLEGAWLLSAYIPYSGECSLNGSQLAKLESCQECAQSHMNLFGPGQLVLDKLHTVDMSFNDSYNSSGYATCAASIVYQ